MPRMTLSPQPIRTDEGSVIRSCLVTGRGDDGREFDHELWFEFPHGMSLPDPTDSDAYLLACLLPAMKCGANIHVRGSVSRALLANLVDLQDVWAKWCPDLYSRVSVEADAVRQNEHLAEGAVAAFSGGADAQFTAYRHAKGLAGHANQSLRAGVFIHGFDIPLTDVDGFSRAAENARRALDDIGLNLNIVRTNVREVSGVNWEHYAGTGLAATLNNFKIVAGAGLIASGEPYDALVEPWASHPMTDPLLSSGDFRIIHDGAGYSRSEKIKILAPWMEGVRQLRVCWVGEDVGRNCGKCEKCVRTRLNFLLAGVANPECFDTPLTKSMLGSVALSSEPARAEWRLIRDEMSRTGRGVELIREVDKVIKRPANRWTRLLPVGSRRRSLVKRFVSPAA